MSKDVVIAGAIVVACLGLVTVAFVLPKYNKKSVATTTDTSTLIANNDSPQTPTPPEPGPTQPELPGNFPTQPLPNPPQLFTGQRPPVGFPPVSPEPPPSAPPLPIDPLPLGEAKVHIVAAHETLGEISMKYYNTSRYWKKIAEANKVDPSELQPGQKLTIPAIDVAPKLAPKDGGTPVVEPGPGEHVYKVKANDSYYNIAKRELGNANRWKELEKLNKIPAEELHAGQTIKLPAKEAGTTPPPGAPPAPGEGLPSAPLGDGRTHIVAKNETLAEISKKYFGTTTRWKDIVKLNPGVDPESLKVGQKLILPEGASATPQSLPGTGAHEGPVAPGETATGDYTIKAGDTLESIAVKELGGRKGVKRIIEANPGLDPNNLVLGKKIKIPGKTKPAEKIAPPSGSLPQPLTPSFPAQPGFGNSPSAPPPSIGNPGAGLGPSSLPPAPGSFGSTPSYPAPPGPAVQPTFGSPPPVKPTFTP